MSRTRSTSPSPKRAKLESPSHSHSPSIVEISPPHPADGGGAEDNEGDHCSICLQAIADRTVIPTCSHEFCFECLLIWTEQSRRCPLCSQAIGEYLIHHIRSKYDYQKHYLAPLRTSPRPLLQAIAAQHDARRRAASRRQHEWGRRQRRQQEEADELERAVEKRRWVYRHHLYAKHVASNPYTRYRPFPTPAQFTASPDLISRATVFLRRELRVWVGLDVEFLTMFTLSLMKSLDIRSEPAVRLLAEFLDMDSGGERVNAEHFAHELYSYLRSPYRDLTMYDNVVQYDAPGDLPPPYIPERSRRWKSRSRSVSPSRSSSRSRSRTRRRPRDADSPSRERINSRLGSEGRRSVPSEDSSTRHPRSYRSHNVSPPRGAADASGCRRSSRQSSREHGLLDRDNSSPQTDRKETRQIRNTSDHQGHPALPEASAQSYRRLDKGKGRADRVIVPDRSSGPVYDDLHPAAPVPADTLTQITIQAAGRPNTLAHNGPRVVDASSYPPDPDDAQTRDPALPKAPTARLYGSDSIENSRQVESRPDNDESRHATPHDSNRRDAPLRVRNRTLLESVHAHLSTNGAHGKQGIRPKANESGHRDRPSFPSRKQIDGSPPNNPPHIQHGSDASIPSSSQWLSDPRPENAGSPVNTGDATGRGPWAVCTSHSFRKENADHLSARAFLPPGKLEDDSFANNPTAGPSITQPFDTNAQLNGSRTTQVTDYLETDATRVRGVVSHSTPIDLRSALLSKLTREKRSLAAPVPDNTSQPVNTSTISTANEEVPMGPSGSSHDHDVEETVHLEMPAGRAAETEARLRSQAHLRVRLAAARKPAAESSGLNESGGEDNWRSAAESHEDLLRARLTSRRKDVDH